MVFREFVKNILAIFMEKGGRSEKYVVLCAVSELKIF